MRTRVPHRESMAASRLDPSLYQTPRLILRPPQRSDAREIFERYASVPEVMRWMAWPQHISVHQTEAFIGFSDGEWRRWSIGPLLITSRADGSLLGSTGLEFETPQRASTGYSLARDAWGQGLASEALSAVLRIADGLGVLRLYALVYVAHERSIRVLERCGFDREGTLRKYQVFPNSGLAEPLDVYCYARVR